MDFGRIHSSCLCPSPIRFPIETTVTTVNRQCSSGLQACANIVGAIKAGYIDIGIGAGVESMTQGWGKGGYEFSDKMSETPLAADCLIPMGITSENVAEQYGSKFFLFLFLFLFLFHFGLVHSSHLGPLHFTH